MGIKNECEFMVFPKGFKYPLIYIGTCKNCKYWNRRNWVFGECTHLLDGAGVYFAAQDRKDIVSAYAIPWKSKGGPIIQMMSGKDFGCVHWEEKE